MRRFLAVLLFVFCLQSVEAQYVWVSLDNNSHYVDVEFRTNLSEPIVLTSEHQPALTYVSMLVDTYGEKIRSGEWSVWIESYVQIEGNTPAQNRARAKVISNTIKSYLICNDRLVEDNFTTRNYSGTLKGRQGLTSIVIGMRYPFEKILPDQRIDWDYNDLVWLTDMASGDAKVKVDFNDVTSVIPGMDTTKIYSPYFDPITFSYPVSKQVVSKHDTLSSDTAQRVVVIDSLSQEPSVSSSIETFDPLLVPNVSPSAVKTSSKSKRGGKRKKAVDPSVETEIPTSVMTGTGLVPIVATDQVGSTAKTKSGKAIMVPFSQANQVLQMPRPDQMIPVPLEVLSKAPIAQIGGSNAAQQSMGLTAGVSHQPSELPLPSLYPSIAAGAPVVSSGVGAVLAAELPDNKVASSKAKKTRAKAKNSVPSASVDEFGRIVIDASGFEQMLSQESLSKIAQEQKVIKRAEYKAVRVAQVDQRLAVGRAKQQAKGRFAVFGVGINALSTLALAPSLQLDAYFSDRFSATVDWTYSRWNYDENYKLNLNTFSPELRFYPMGRTKEFSGLYVGLYGMVGAYNYRWNSREGRQSDFWSAGLSLGYVLPIGKSGFYLEAGLAAGYIDQKVDLYTFHQGENYRIGSQNEVMPFAPTKIKVSFLYRIFNKK